MKFTDISEIYRQGQTQISQAQRDFQEYWRDANGMKFSEGVLGGLAENLTGLDEYADSAAVRQRNNELCRGAIADHINVAKLRDEAQDAKNKELEAECAALETELDIAERAQEQLREVPGKVRHMLDRISHIESVGSYSERFNWAE